ncbi:armadillo-type protein [Ochromonadaceae sp. CCMP2298]|nr:armadillo-type protein [Ochromonadaceae sp. CCMP2298]
MYKRAVEPIIVEFFVSGDVSETASALQDIGAPEYAYEFVKRLVNKSCDKGDREREHVSQLLSALYPDLLSSNMVGKGFERLFEIMDEVEKDVPAAKQLLGTFLARAVADEVLPPSFLADGVVRNLGGEVVELAKLMLSRDHGGAKLEHSWGPGDGRPVEGVKVAVDQLLQEYLLSSDVGEAVRCIAELKSPFFFHEIVKRTVCNAMDKSSAQQLLMSALMEKLSTAGLLSTEQAVKGFDRLYSILPDLVLDTPSARSILDGFTERAKGTVLPKTYLPPTDTPE